MKSQPMMLSVSVMKFFLSQAVRCASVENPQSQGVSQISKQQSLSGATVDESMSVCSDEPVQSNHFASFIERIVSLEGKFYESKDAETMKHKGESSLELSKEPAMPDGKNSTGSDAEEVKSFLKEIFESDFRNLALTYAEGKDSIFINNLPIFLWDLMVSYNLTDKPCDLEGVNLHDVVKRRLKSSGRDITYSDVLLAKAFNHVYNSGENPLQNICWFFNGFKTVIGCKGWDSPEISRLVKAISGKFGQNMISCFFGKRNPYAYKYGTEFEQVCDESEKLETAFEKLEGKEHSIFSFNAFCLLFEDPNSAEKRDDISLDFFLLTEILRKKCGAASTFLLSEYLYYYPGRTFLDEMIVYNSYLVSRHTGTLVEKILPFIFDNAYLRVRKPCSEESLGTLNDLACVRGGEVQCCTFRELNTYSAFRKTVKHLSIDTMCVCFNVRCCEKANNKDEDLCEEDVAEVYDKYVEEGMIFNIDIRFTSYPEESVWYEIQKIVEIHKKTTLNTKALLKRIRFKLKGEAWMEIFNITGDIVSLFAKDSDGNYFKRSALKLPCWSVFIEYCVQHIRAQGYVPTGIYINRSVCDESVFVFERRDASQGFICKEIHGKFLFDNEVSPYFFPVGEEILHLVGKYTILSYNEYMENKEIDFISACWRNRKKSLEVMFQDAEIVSIGVINTYHSH